MRNKANILNMTCLFVGLILGFIGTSLTIQNIDYSYEVEPTATIALMILSGFLILSGVIGYNIQSKK